MERRLKYLTERTASFGRMYDFDELYTFVKKEAMRRGMRTSFRALEYACEKHAKQKRSGGQPYAVHPLWMARYLLLQSDSAITDVTIATSLIHDVPEENPEISVNDLPFELAVREAVGCLTIIKQAGEPVFERRVKSAEMMLRNKDAAIVRAVDTLNILHTIPQAFGPDRIRKIVLENHMFKIPKMIEAGEIWPETRRLMMKLVEEIRGIIYAYAVIYGIRLGGDPNFVNGPEAKDYSYLLH